MTSNVVNIQPQGGAILGLSNIAVAERAVARLVGRDPLDPGLAVFSGPSGYGKSTALAWVRARHPSYYVQADDFWTKKTMLAAISRAMGISYLRDSKDKKSQRTYLPDIGEMAEAIKVQLEKSKKILIIDEFDYVADKNLVEAVRSLYEGSKASILFAGEEALPQKLEKWERFHGRILDWFLAEPVCLADARLMADAKCRNVVIADNLLEQLVALAEGSVRRVSNNLGRIFDEANEQGWDSVDKAKWGERSLQQSKAPKREKLKKELNNGQ